jgi:hypothetical protein
MSQTREALRIAMDDFVVAMFRDMPASGGLARRMEVAADELRSVMTAHIGPPRSATSPTDRPGDQTP